MPARFAAAKQAGATQEEIFETLYLAMRAAARGTWSTIKTSIDGIEDQVQSVKGAYEAEAAKAKL